MQTDDVISALETYEAELTGILSRFREDRSGIHIDQKDDARYRAMVLELRDLFDDEFLGGRRHSQPLLAYFNDSVSNYVGSPSFKGVENVKGVVVAALARVKRNPEAVLSNTHKSSEPHNKSINTLELIAERFHRVVLQLRRRHDSRTTLAVEDEYDVQDLLHALLELFFEDIRKEEWTPSYAGGASRMDFLLPEIEAVIETKMARPSLSTKELGEQLIVDIAKYRNHPDCRTLYCIVYDPANRISNPRGVESDLNENSERIIVRVMIVPK